MSISPNFSIVKDVPYEVFDDLVKKMNESNPLRLDNSSIIPQCDGYLQDIKVVSLDSKKDFVTSRGALFLHCEKIGNVIADRDIFLKNCPDHEWIMSSNGNIHVFNTNTEKLRPGQGKTIYVYAASKENPLKRKLFD